MKSNPFKSEKYNKNYYIKKRKLKSENKFLSAIKNLLVKERKFKPLEKNKFKTQDFSYKEKPVYLDSYIKRKLPVWVIPSISIVLIILLVFWIGPTAIKTIEGFIVQPEENSPGSNLLYNSDYYSVVSVQTADIYQSPDIMSKKMTQVLYNEVVEILEEDRYGFVKVRLNDGFEGYVKNDSIVSNTESVEPFLYSHKLVVTSQTKRVMSHSSSGSLIIEAVMGTILYSDYQGSNIYRVALPDGNYGWISASGLIRLEPGENIKESTQKNFYETALSFNNTTYFDGGMTKYGASMEGVLYISSLVNGIKLPRDLQLQINYGEEINLEYDSESGEILYNKFQNGDLIFFGKTENSKLNVTGIGIVTGYGQILTVKKSSASIRIVKLDENLSLKNSILSVRRLIKN